jgi:hypothetical protein
MMENKYLEKIAMNRLSKFMMKTIHTPDMTHLGNQMGYKVGRLPHEAKGASKDLGKLIYSIEEPGLDVLTNNGIPLKNRIIHRLNNHYGDKGFYAYANHKAKMDRLKEYREIPKFPWER